MSLVGLMSGGRGGGMVPMSDVWVSLGLVWGGGREEGEEKEKWGGDGVGPRV